MSTATSYYIFNGKIDQESVIKLLEAVSKSGKDPMVIFFRCSSGGEVSVGQILTGVLNDHKEGIILVASEHICSAGFEVFKNFRGKRYLVYGTQGMTHFTRMDLTTMSNGGHAYQTEGESNKRTLEIWKRSDLRMCVDLKFTDVEKDLFTSGEDVYFDMDRLLEMFPDVRIWGEEEKPDLYKVELPVDFKDTEYNVIDNISPEMAKTYSGLTDDFHIEPYAPAPQWPETSATDVLEDPFN